MLAQPAKLQVSIIHGLQLKAEKRVLINGSTTDEDPNQRNEPEETAHLTVQLKNFSYMMLLTQQARDKEMKNC